MQSIQTPITSVLVASIHRWQLPINLFLRYSSYYLMFYFTIFSTKFLGAQRSRHVPCPTQDLGSGRRAHQSRDPGDVQAAGGQRSVLEFFGYVSGLFKFCKFFSFFLQFYVHVCHTFKYEVNTNFFITSPRFFILKSFLSC